MFDLVVFPFVFSYHILSYSTDYGRHWHQGTFLNETLAQIRSVITDPNNRIYAVASNTDNLVNLIEFDFNLLVGRCARHR
jgi:hypothetical protein